MGRCDTCFFWQRTAPSLGECRRRAPVPTVAFGSVKHEAVACWPHVRDTDWCGEYETYAAPRPQFLDSDSARDASQQPARIM